MSAAKGKGSEFTAVELKCIASLVEKEQKKLTGSAAKIPVGFNQVGFSVIVDGSLTKGPDTEATARFPEALFWKMMYRAAMQPAEGEKSEPQATKIFEQLAGPTTKIAALENEIIDAVRLESAVRGLWNTMGPKSPRAGQSQVAGVIRKSEA